MRRFGEVGDPAATSGKTRLSSYERRLAEERLLKFNTNLGLAIAVFIGLLVCWAHGGIRTTSITALGASLGVGGVLGFLFGVPSAAKAPVNIGRIGSVAVDTGTGSTVRAANVNMAPAGSENPPHPASPPSAHQPASVTSVPEQIPPDPLTAAGTRIPAIAAATTAPAAPHTPGSSAPAEAPGSKTPAASQPPADPQPPATTTPAPSNLEQVADWVTKLLLGGGLTQMQRIPPKIWQWSHVIAVGIIGNSAAPTQQIVPEQAFACGLLVYGFVLGFFGGFLITKLQLGRAIAE